MKKQHRDFQKDLQKVKSQLVSFSREATVFAKKSEKEIIKISKQSKLRLDSSTANLRREHLFYQLGKEYSRAKFPEKPNAKMKQLITALGKTEKEIKSLNRKIKTVK